MKEEPWSFKKEPSLVLPDLLARIGSHSPEIVLLISQYLTANDEGVADRVTYTGTDPSGALVFMLIESLLTFERLRIELNEQVIENQIAGNSVPGHQMLALSDLVVLEPNMLQAVSIAFEIHLNVWGANKGDYLSKMDTEKEEETDKLKDRGRWGKES